MCVHILHVLYTYLCLYIYNTLKYIFYPQKPEVHPVAPVPPTNGSGSRIRLYLGPLKVIVFHTETVRRVR